MPMLPFVPLILVPRALAVFLIAAIQPLTLTQRSGYTLLLFVQVVPALFKSDQTIVGSGNEDEYHWQMPVTLRTLKKTGTKSNGNCTSISQ